MKKIYLLLAFIGDGDIDETFIGPSYEDRVQAHNELDKIKKTIAKIVLRAKALEEKRAAWVSANPYPEDLLLREEHGKIWMEEEKFLRPGFGLKPGMFDKYPELFNLSECAMFLDIGYDVREIGLVEAQ